MHRSSELQQMRHRYEECIKALQEREIAVKEEDEEAWRVFNSGMEERVMEEVKHKHQQKVGEVMEDVVAALEQGRHKLLQDLSHLRQSGSKEQAEAPPSDKAT